MGPSEIVDEFIAAIERRDVASAVTMMSDEVSYENMPIDPILGPVAVARTLEAFLAPAEEVEWRILRRIESGNLVVNERLDRFRIGGDWLELPVAGFFEITGGKISRWRDYFDMGTYTNRLAELSPPD